MDLLSKCKKNVAFVNYNLNSVDNCIFNNTVHQICKSLVNHICTSVVNYFS